MIVSFDTAVKRAHGLPAAIVLYYLTAWLKVNKAKSINVHKNHVWIYRSAKSISKDVEFDERTIKRAIKTLVDAGLIISETRKNKNGYVCNWYTTNDFRIKNNQSKVSSSGHSATPPLGHRAPPPLGHSAPIENIKNREIINTDNGGGVSNGDKRNRSKNSPTDSPPPIQEVMALADRLFKPGFHFKAANQLMGDLINRYGHQDVRMGVNFALSRYPSGLVFRNCKSQPEAFLQALGLQEKRLLNN